MAIATAVSAELYQEDRHEDRQDRLQDDRQERIEEQVLHKENKLQVLESLRQKLKGQYSTGFGVLPFSLLDGGVPKGALVHIHGLSGTGKTQMTLKFLSENPSSKVAWVEDEFNVYPISFSQMGAGLGRILFVSAHRDSLWALSQVLNSQLFEIVIYSGSNIHVKETELRRFQLMAEKSGSSCFFLSENEDLSSQGDWSLSLKLQALRQSMEDPPHLRVIKSKRLAHSAGN